MSTNKIKAIVKRPGEPVGHIEYLSNDIRTFQRIVDGYVESLRITTGPSMWLLCNEDGLLRGLEHNFSIQYRGRSPIHIVGTVAIVGESDADMTDVPITIDCWKRLLERWGNQIRRK